jgi:hypothetical protein
MIAHVALLILRHDAGNPINAESAATIRRFGERELIGASNTTLTVTILWQ